jgi:prephenate dehydrogenase
METVAIVGVGLIGGSFALALREAGFTGTIVGVSSPRTIEEALRLKVVDRGATLDAACARADLVYLAGPIHTILATVPRLNGLLKPGALVTDAGSTKARICAAGAALTGAQFLGAHPMAGKETRGVGAAEAGLFRGRPYLLTPQSPLDMETPAAREFVEWVKRIGAVPRVMAPERHDRVVALSSHLPQLLSTCLAASLEHSPRREDVAAAAGPGLLDSTRLALSAWEIWHDILDTNREAILEALDLFADNWGELRLHLSESDLAREFADGAGFAAHLREKPAGAKSEPRVASER